MILHLLTGEILLPPTGFIPLELERSVNPSHLKSNPENSEGQHSNDMRSPKLFYRSPVNCLPLYYKLSTKVCQSECGAMT